MNDWVDWQTSGRIDKHLNSRAASSITNIDDLYDVHHDNFISIYDTLLLTNKVSKSLEEKLYCLGIFSLWKLKNIS